MSDKKTDFMQFNPMKLLEMTDKKEACDILNRILRTMVVWSNYAEILENELGMPNKCTGDVYKLKAVQDMTKKQKDRYKNAE